MTDQAITDPLVTYTPLLTPTGTVREDIMKPKAPILDKYRATEEIIKSRQKTRDDRI